jgi:PAS domain S-box-containing protein
MALVRYYSGRNDAFLILGVAFIGTGLLDGYHAIVTSPFLAPSFPSEHSSLIPWSWLTSRMFLAVLLYWGLVTNRRSMHKGTVHGLDERAVYVGAGLLTLASFVFFAFVPLPRAYYPEFFIHRPEELLPAGIFGVALLGYLRKGGWKTEPLGHWLVLSLIVSLAVQLPFMALSAQLFDAEFDAAHVLKAASYVCVLIGLLINMFHSFRTVGREVAERRKIEEKLRETQERFQFALEASSDGLWDWNINTGDVFFSPRWAESLGYSPEEVLPHFDFWKVVIHPDDIGPTLQKVEKYFNGETEIYINENRLLMKSGEYRYNLDRARIVAWNPDGTPQRMVGTDIDITAQKASEKALRASELRHRSVVETMVDGLVTIGGDGVIQSFNPGAGRIFGYSPDEIVGQNVRTLMPEPSRSLHDSYIERYLTTGQQTVIGSWREVIGQRRDGSNFPMALSVTEMRVGEDLLFTGMIRDISEAKEAEEELQRYVAEVEAARSKIEKQADALAKHTDELSVAKDRAEEATVAKSQFLASMSHEIRTPMNGVLGMTQLLLDTKLTPEQLEHATTIRSSADALLTIINDILDFSKIEAGRLEIEPIPFDMQTAVAEVMELVVGKAEAKGLELVIRYPTDQPKNFLADPGRIRQILLNLVSNAVKFTQSGYVMIHIDAARQVGREEALVRFEVRDTGIGVDPDSQTRLFQPFSQADASTTRRFGGTGLGLVICKRLVELMDGEIGMESELGRGSTFWFQMPLAIEANMAIHQIPHVDVSGVRVLVVDDIDVNRRVFKEQLETYGMVVDCAESGRMALDMLQRAARAGEPFSMVLTDYLMPGMDGEGLARTILADKAFGEPRLVISTSAPNRGDARRFREVGFDGYVTKPVPPESLRDILVTVLAHEGKQFITRHTVREARSAEAAQLSEKTYVPDATLDHVRVLLAEDNVVNQKVAARMLQKFGCRVDVAANGAEAVTMWRDLPYDIVFMDCQMPGVDGFEATRRIRTIEGTERRTPIVALTANAMRGDREACIGAGMDDYLSKPIDALQLRDLLLHWVPANLPG